MEGRIYWIEQYVKLLQVQGDERGERVPFLLWPSQKKLLRDIHRESDVLILKARQLGVSTVIMADNLGECLFVAGTEILVMSQDKDAAQYQMRRFFDMYNCLPPFLKLPIERQTLDMCEFKGARWIRALASTPNAGSGFTGSRVFRDEIAKHEYARDNLQAVGPAISAGGKLIECGTAERRDEYLKSEWMKATTADPPTRFTVFFNWKCRPGRDAAFYQEQLDRHGADGVRQEYPSSPEEAFIAAGGTVFPASTVEMIVPEEPAFKPEMWAHRFIDLAHATSFRGKCCLKVWRFPRRDDKGNLLERFAVLADPGGGSITSDPSAIVVFSSQGDQVAEYNERCDVDQCGLILHELSQVYPGLVSFERNALGVPMTRILLDKKTKGLYRETPATEKGERPGKEGGLYGFHMGKSSKEQWMTDLDMSIRNGDLVIKSAVAKKQLAVYEWKLNGRMGAPHGGNDDLVTGIAICNQLRMKLPRMQIDSTQFINRLSQLERQKTGSVYMGY